MALIRDINHRLDPSIDDTDADRGIGFDGTILFPTFTREFIEKSDSLLLFLANFFSIFFIIFCSFLNNFFCFFDKIDTLFSINEPRSLDLFVPTITAGTEFTFLTFEDIVEPVTLGALIEAALSKDCLQSTMKLFSGPGRITQ